MNTTPKTSIGVFAAIGLVTVGLNFFVEYGIDCQSFPLRSTTSPSGSHFANLVLKSCEVEEDIDVHLRVGREAENSFSSVRIFGTTSTDFELRWRSNSELEVITPETIQESKIPSTLKDVDIRIVRRPSGTWAMLRVSVYGRKQTDR